MQDSSLDVRQYITFLMSALATRGNRLLDDYLRSHGISLGSFYIMSLIVSTKGDQMSQKTIADSLLMNVNTVTRYLDEMEKIGHARRVPNPDNRKENLIEVTQEGRRCVRDAYAGIEKIRRKAYAAITHAEFEQLRNTLLKLYQADRLERENGGEPGA